MKTENKCNFDWHIKSSYKKGSDKLKALARPTSYISLKLEAVIEFLFKCKV